MSAGGWLRRLHRQVSVAFTLAGLAPFVALALRPGQPPAWVTYSPLLPLFVLLATGAYLFVLPYVGRSRAAPAPGGGADA